MSVLLSARGALVAAAGDPERVALRQQRQGSHADAHVAGQLGLGASVGLEVEVSEIDQVVAHDVPDGEHLEGDLADLDGVAGTGPVLGDRRLVQHRDVVQLGGGAGAEEDQQPVAEERLDLAAHLGDGRLVDGRGHASSTSSGFTPETKSSSVMNWARGPAGLVAWMSTVLTFFIG